MCQLKSVRCSLFEFFCLINNNLFLSYILEAFRFFIIKEILIFVHLYVTLSTHRAVGLAFCLPHVSKQNIQYLDTLKVDQPSLYFLYDMMVSHIIKWILLGEILIISLKIPEKFFCFFRFHSNCLSKERFCDIKTFITRPLCLLSSFIVYIEYEGYHI